MRERQAISAAALVLFGLAVASVPQARAQELPQGVTQEMVQEGRAVFTGDGFCYTCHGNQGRGMQGLGADLTDADWLHGDGSYSYIVRRVQQGVSANASTSGVPMPPRGGARLTDAEVRAVAAYVWSLSRGG